jgi:hypothetical protein
VKTVHTAVTEIEAVTLHAGLPEPVLPVERWDLLVPDGRAAEAAEFLSEYLESVEEAELR